MARRPAGGRTYSPTEPVFARYDLKFSGRPVATRAQVPEEYFRSARDRRVAWEARKIDHARDIPPKKTSVASAAPAALPAATAQAAEAAAVSVLKEPTEEALAAAGYAAKVYGLDVKDFQAASAKLTAESDVKAEITPAVAEVLAQVDAVTAPPPAPSPKAERRGRGR